MHEEQVHRWFPLFVDLRQWRILVVGAGNIARRRVRTLLEFGPGHIQVVAPEAESRMEEWKSLPNVGVCGRTYQAGDLENCQMVLAATDDAALNEAIGRACRERGILVNVASDRALCDFHFPGVVFDGPVTVGINAAGRDHRRAKEVRKQIEGLLCQGGKDAG